MRGATVLFVAAFSFGAPAQVMANPSACVVTPVHYGRHPRIAALAGMPQGVPWIVAQPKSAHIIAFLWFSPPGARGQAALMHTNGNGPAAGSSDKILWYATQGKPTRILTVTGRNLSSSGTMRGRFTLAGGGGGYPSILDMPTPGYWRVTVRSGNVKGHVTFEVLP